MKYICTYCNVFVFDQEKGDQKVGLKPNIKIEDIEKDWECPVCHQDKSYLTEIKESLFLEKKKSYESSS